MGLQKAADIENISVIPTGLFIDKLLGCGGIPRKRIVELVGAPGGGKSTLCLQIVAEAQKTGARCLWVDIEGTFTPLYARKLGVEMEKLDVLRERNGEDALNQVIEFVENETYDLIVFDSIGQIVPREAREKQIGERQIGGQARIIGHFIRNVAVMLPEKNVAIIGVNQQQVDIMTGKTSSRGGESWNYHKAVSVHLKKKFGVVLKQGENVIGFQVTAEVREKNKMAGNVGLKIDANFINGEGFSKSADLLGDAIDAGVLEKRGNTFYFEGEKLGMISKVRELVKDESFAEKLKTAIDGLQSA